LRRALWRDEHVLAFSLTGACVAGLRFCNLNAPRLLARSSEDADDCRSDLIAMTKESNCTRRWALLAPAVTVTGAALGPSFWFSALAQDARRNRESPFALELRRLENRAEKLGLRSPRARARAAEASDAEPEAFRNMKARALELIDGLGTLQGPQPRAAMVDAGALLRQIHRDERSVPAPSERAAVRRPPFDDTIKAEYRRLYEGCAIKAKYRNAVQADMEQVLKNKPRYDIVEGKTKVRWYVIGVIHNLEASFNFSGHLHNGDDISRRTHTEPKGLPKNWEPPKSASDWEESAVDALTHDRFTGNTDWSLERTLYLLEGYNGWGPRQAHRMHTPYLWSYSESYTSGKYDYDGHWNATLTSDQCGAAVLMKALQEAGHISPPL
jgi:lysozyme family protein